VPPNDNISREREEIPGLRPPSRIPWIVIGILAVILIGYGLKRGWMRAERVTPAQPPSLSERGGAAETRVAAQPAPGGETPSPVASPGASQIVAAVRGLIGSGQLGEARAKCFAYLASSPAPVTADQRAVEAVLGDVNTALVFSASPAEEKTNYVIRAGDSLDALARRHGTTVELLKKSNGIAVPSRIRQGDVVRILTGRFRIEVRRTRMELVVYLNDRFFKRYVVGIGREGRTPVGTFTVSDRIVEPVWWRPDGKQIPFGNPENILGTRWLALRATSGTADVKGYGIHGTWDEKSVGKAESAGCVRMRNAEVEQLYDLISLGTPVTILDP